jgi:hypothetical protein
MTTFATRPDPRYYINIQQHDDGNYSADQMPLDDSSTTRVDMTGSQQTKVIPGLRSQTKDQINAYAQTLIYTYAPAWVQSNALHVITTGSPPADLADANATWQWINDSRAIASTECAKIDGMNFNQIVVYVIPKDTWPAPPANLLPALAMTPA